MISIVPMFRKFINPMGEPVGFQKKIIMVKTPDYEEPDEDDIPQIPNVIDPDEDEFLPDEEDLDPEDEELEDKKILVSAKPTG